MAVCLLAAHYATHTNTCREGERSYHSPLGGYGRCEMSGVTYYDSMRALHTISWSLGPADGLTGGANANKLQCETAETVGGTDRNGCVGCRIPKDISDSIARARQQWFAEQ